MRSKVRMSPSLSSGENFDDAIPTSAYYPSTVLTPNDGANAFAAHETVAGDLLGAASFFQRPVSQTGVMAS